jgi:predicted transcriptional regulator
MARRYNAIERRELGEKVVRLSGRGMSNRRIAKAVGINPRTVARLQREYLKEADPGPEISRVQAIQGHQEVIDVCWSKINSSGRELANGTIVPTISPHGLAGLANTIQGSIKETARLRGVEPPERVEVGHTFLDLIKRNADRPRHERMRVVDAEIDEHGDMRMLEPSEIDERARRRGLEAG